MSWRGTLLLAILAALSASLLLFSAGNRSRSATEPLLRISPADATRITIIEGGGAVVLTKKNGIWSIEGDGADRADARMVRSLLNNAASLLPLDVLPARDLKGPVSPAALGLDKPKRTLTIEDGKRHTIRFGIEGAAPGRVYVRLGSGGPVYLVSSEVASTAFQPSREFRDSRLTSLTPERVAGVSYSKEGALQQLQLRKTGAGWTIGSPVTARCDDDAVDNWLNRLLSARVTRWMPEGTEPSSCGLETPAAVLTVHEREGEPPVVISIGNPVPGTETARYVRCSDRPGISVVEGFSTLLDPTPSSFRSRQLTKVLCDAVDRIEITGQPDGATSSSVLLRKKGSEDWSLQNGTTVPEASVRDWFSKLQALSAARFEPATPERLTARGMTPPAVTIRLVARLSENSAEEQAGDVVLASYSFGSNAGGETALRDGDATDLMILPTESLREMKTGPTPGTLPGTKVP